MSNIATRGAGLGALGAGMLLLAIAAAHAQSTILPPACFGKTGAELDQCVRDLTAPAGTETFEPIERKADPRSLLNCNVVDRADQAFCIARNEIILECRTPARHADFDACANRLVARLQPPRAADCARAAPRQREFCAARNNFLGECLQDPWLYFICLGEKYNPR